MKINKPDDNKLTLLRYDEMLSIEGGEIILNDQAAVADGAARLISGVYEFFSRAGESFARQFKRVIAS